MIIKAFTIENFKCISNPITIDITPITLLFGPNSAGKSSIIQALHYAREIFQNSNFDPDQTASGGSSIDLGGFKSFVNNHDLNKTIKISFKVEFDPYILPFYSLPDADPSYLEELPYDYIIDDIKEVTVKIDIKWSSWLNKPLAVKYEVWTMEKEIAQITASDDGQQVFVSFINFNHPLFFINSENNDDLNERENFFEQLSYSIKANRIEGNSVNLGVLDQVSAIPKWGEPIEFQSEIWEEPLSSDSQDDKKLFIWILSRILVGSGEMLRNALSRFRYLGPLRDVPPRNYLPMNTIDESRWSNGLAAWEVLHRADEESYRKLNSWLLNKDKFNSGYRIELKRFKEIDEKSPLMLSMAQDSSLDDSESIKKFLEQLPTKSRVFIRADGSDIELFPQDIGVGISQLLPVVIAALYTNVGIVAIEQPELHIHPALQVVLGDLFISQSKERKVSFLIETHSEHLLLRLLRRIRETGEDEFPSGKEPLLPDQLSVYYVEQGKNGVSLTKIRVDGDGEFIDCWPKGFFSERAEELF